jgi:hypothetical protein
MKNQILLVSAVLITLSGCRSTLNTGNGGYTDLSLTVNPSDYELVRLEEIKSNTKQIAGIPLDKNVGLDYGHVDRFYSFSSASTKNQGSAAYRLQPILTLAVLELPILYLSGQLWKVRSYDFDNNGNYRETHPYRGLAFMTFVIGSGISAAYNNALWDPSKRAIQRLNREIVDKNPDVDVFLNPKYKIERNQGIFQSEATVRLNAMGAKIETVNNPKPKK